MAAASIPSAPASASSYPRGVGHGAYDLLLHELGHAVYHAATTFTSVDGPNRLDSALAYSDPAIDKTGSNLYRYWSSQGRTGAGAGQVILQNGRM